MKYAIYSKMQFHVKAATTYTPKSLLHVCIATTLLSHQATFSLVVAGIELKDTPKWLFQFKVNSLVIKHAVITNRCPYPQRIGTVYMLVEMVIGGDESIELRKCLCIHQMIISNTLDFFAYCIKKFAIVSESGPTYLL